jgi:hypothetical protein
LDRFFTGSASIGRENQLSRSLERHEHGAPPEEPPEEPSVFSAIDILFEDIFGRLDALTSRFEQLEAKIDLHGRLARIEAHLNLTPITSADDRHSDGPVQDKDRTITDPFKITD